MDKRVKTVDRKKIVISCKQTLFTALHERVLQVDIGKTWGP